MYVIDHSTLDQLHLVAKRWEGNYCYVENYRVSGGFLDQRREMEACLDKCRVWIASSLKSSGYNEALARSMKQSCALMQNELHTGAETLNMGHERKSSELRKAIEGIVQLDIYWHDFLYKLDINDRQRMDLMNLYYALPSPDCDPQQLFKKASEVMKNAHRVDPVFFKGFLDYCKSYDLCKLLCKMGQNLKFSCVDGYEVEDKHWFKKCKKGVFRLPPDDEMGKAWAEGTFPFVDTVASWYWEASDVTRVVPELGVYTNMKAPDHVKRYEHNELLYALNHAPDICPGIAPGDALEGVVSGTTELPCIAGMAAKNENTKPREKTRETWSADAVTREVTTTYDRTALQLATVYDGASIRKPDYVVQRGFNRICDLTDPDSDKNIIIVSNDVSGWSPQGDREAWALHHDYIARMSKIPRGLCMRNIWRTPIAVLNKRGYINSVSLPSGLFQGWTGTMDTLLNVHLSLYSVRESKRNKILSDREGAITAGLIDDAVQAIELCGNLEERQNAADGHFATTVAVWAGAGAEIDAVKTLYSSVKFVFLNRMFCEGSEVLVPMKVFARADKEWNRRFSSIHSQFETASSHLGRWVDGESLTTSRG